MIESLREGFRAVRRNWGLVVLLLVPNLLLARLLAGPLREVLERDLRNKGASVAMMNGFDHDWWKAWSEGQEGWTGSFAPDVFGTGFVFKNLDQLLRGALPLRLVHVEAPNGDERDDRAPILDPVILGVAFLYWLVQLFLTGGVLGVLRSPSGGWTVRGLLHGSGFYFGRLLRVAILALLAVGVVFLLNRPFAGWVDTRAREAVSETTALSWLFGRHALLLLAILFVHAVSSYAKIAIVLQERSSALLAVLTSLGFVLSHLGRVAGQYLAVGLASALLLGLWAGIDARWATTGYKSQGVTLLLFQAVVLSRIGLRLVLLGGQLALYRGRGERA
ncbi:MAG TPA: hypothetical protein VIC87_08850 [Vicinamibacteria bacterium]